MSSNISNSKKLQNNLSLYINSIEEYPQLTNEQKNELAKRIQQGDDEALKTLFLCNTRLVIHIAEKMQKKSGCSHVPLEDLIQYGNQGLFDACRVFDPQKGNFSSFAGKYIRHTIKRNVDNQGYVLRYPVSFRDRQKRYALSHQKLYQILQRDPTPEEIAADTNMSIKQARELAGHTPISSTDVEVGDAKQTVTVLDLIADPKSSVPDIFAQQEMMKKIDAILDKYLDDRERTIVKMRLGLYDGRKHTLEEVGQKYHLSRERIRQIYNASIKKLQRNPSVKQTLGQFL